MEVVWHVMVEHERRKGREGEGEHVKGTTNEIERNAGTTNENKRNAGTTNEIESNKEISHHNGQTQMCIQMREGDR